MQNEKKKDKISLSFSVTNNKMRNCNQMIGDISLYHLIIKYEIIQTNQ